MMWVHMISLLQSVKVNEIYHELGKASCMVYAEAQLVLRKDSKICLNPLRFTVLRETKRDDRVMRHAL